MIITSYIHAWLSEALDNKPRSDQHGVEAVLQTSRGYEKQNSFFFTVEFANLSGEAPTNETPLTGPRPLCFRKHFKVRRF